MSSLYVTTRASSSLVVTAAVVGTLGGCLPQPPIRVRWQQRLAAFNRWLTCNLTIDVAEVVRTAKAMEAGCVDKCDKGSRLWGRG